MDLDELISCEIQDTAEAMHYANTIMQVIIYLWLLNKHVFEFQSFHCSVVLHHLPNVHCI